MKTKLSQKEVAEILGRSPSSISREVKKGLARGMHGIRQYSIGKARRVTYERRRVANQQHRKLGFDADLTRYVRRVLMEDQSPEQIVGRMRGFGDFRISHTSIYRYISQDAQALRIHLHSQKGKYRRTQSAGLRALKRRQLSEKRDITERPREAKIRSELGHWEGDTVMGTDREVRIVTSVDRRSGYLLAELIPRQTTEHVRSALVQSFSRVPNEKCQTLTLDNGAEFTNWQFFEKDLGLTVYFAKPYHSWERGTNENTNGLLRHYFPKKTSFATLKPQHLKRAVFRLNNRPRKRLGYLTPHEVFHGIAI
jgi:IS30 family transposase